MMSVDYRQLGGAIKVLTKAELLTGQSLTSSEASQSSLQHSLETPSLTEHEILIDSKCQDCSGALIDLIIDGSSQETVPHVRSGLVWSQRSQRDPWQRRCFKSMIAS